MGAPHKPFFRVVVSDSRKATTASAVEEVGYYDPRHEPPVFEVDRQRIDHWVGNGAQMSATLKRLIKSEDKGWPLKEKKAKAAPAPEPAAEEPAEEPAEEAAPAQDEEAAAEPAEPAEASEATEAAAAAEPAEAEAATEDAADETPAETPEAEASADAEAEPEGDSDADAEQKAADEAVEGEAEDNKASAE